MLTITPYYEGVDLPEGYESYIKERNGNLAATLGESMGMPHSENFDGPIEEAYPLLAQPVLRAAFHTDDPTRFYGAVVDHLQHGTKGLLKAAIRSDEVPDHLPQDREALTKVSLPGYLAFNVDQAVEAYHSLRRAGFTTVRLKDPMESDANGQYVIQSEAGLRRRLQSYDHRFKGEIGMVVEGNLDTASNSNMGETILPDGSRVSFIGKQRDLPGNTGFAGIDMFVAHRPLADLLHEVQKCDPKLLHGLNPRDLVQAIDQTRELMGVSRLSFDIIGGKAAGENVAGIADITTRVGGTCPGVFEGLKMMRSVDKDAVYSSVSLTYNPKPMGVLQRFGRAFDEREGVVYATYIDQPRLRIDTRTIHNAAYQLFRPETQRSDRSAIGFAF